MPVVRHLLGLALAFGALSMAASPARAEQRVTLRHPLSPELRAIAEDLLTDVPGQGDMFILTDDGRVDPDRDIYGGFATLDGDDTMEIVFWITTFSWCGSIGCPLEIFKKFGDKWRYIGGDYSQIESFTVLDQTDGGFHRISAGFWPGCQAIRVLIWNGREYSAKDPCPDE
jgi:hypothetical protein